MPAKKHSKETKHHSKHKDEAVKEKMGHVSKEKHHSKKPMAKMCKGK